MLNQHIKCVCAYSHGKWILMSAKKYEKKSTLDDYCTLGLTRIRASLKYYFVRPTASFC